MERMVCKHLELKETIDEKILELTQELIVLEKAVETLEDPIERAVMRYRYFEGYSWGRISEATHYSPPQLYRYHGYALLKLKDYGSEEPETEEAPDASDLVDDDPCIYCEEDDCEGCMYYEED